MITESFLNSCFSIILNKGTKIKKTKILYRDILDVLKFSESQETVSIPITIASKLNCLKKILELLLTDKTLENTLDSVFFSENFKQHMEFVTVKINEELKEPILQDCISQVRLRKKINTLFQNYDELDKVLSTIKDGSFESMDDIIEDYEITIKTLYSNMMENNRIGSIESSSSLDLVKDEYDDVSKMITQKYNKENKTSSGFDYLDELLHGGYEPSRLYVWGGGSGSGKSVLLNNTIVYSASKNNQLNKHHNLNPGEINNVYIYVTCENTIEESLMRTYMPMYNKTQTEMLRENDPNYLKKQIIEQLAKNNSTIIMKYFPAYSISSFDLMSVIDDAIETYGKESIAGLYIDYLDLLKTDTKYDIYRMELGHITVSLKTLAVQYNIPIITATQLGRNAYKINDSKDLSLDQISESIKKVEHADFVGLIAKDPLDSEIVHCKIGKHRSGACNIAFDFKVDFSRYKYLKAHVLSNKQKSDVVSQSQDKSNLLRIDQKVSGKEIMQQFGY